MYAAILFDGAVPSAAFEPVDGDDVSTNCCRAESNESAKTLSVVRLCLKSELESAVVSAYRAGLHRKEKTSRNHRETAGVTSFHRNFGNLGCQTGRRRITRQGKRLGAVELENKLPEGGTVHSTI